jgi:hypothetical protein
MKNCRNVRKEKLKREYDNSNSTDDDDDDDYNEAKFSVQI